MGLLDELITRYSLDSKDYEKGADKVTAATKRTAEWINNLGMNAIGTLRSGLTMALSPVVALAGSGGILALVGASVNAAMSFDTMTRSLTAVTGSAERARDVFKFVDQLAMPSVFDSAGLAEGALQLEAFGLKAERFLPIAEKLGTVFGGTQDKLMQFVAALGYINAERFGEGFEALGAGGISRKSLELRGLEFDKQGSFKGSVSQAFDAIEAEVNARFGGLAKTMADGPAAKLASVMDAIGRGARRAGNAFLTLLMPAAERLGGFIAWLVESGYIDRAFRSLVNMFNGRAMGDWVIRAIAYIVATIQDLPYLIRVAGDMFTGFFTFLRDNFITLGKIWVGIWAFSATFNGLRALVGAINALRKAEEGLTIVAAIRSAIQTQGASLLYQATIAGLAAWGAVKAVEGLAGAAEPLTPLPELEMIGNHINMNAEKMIQGWGVYQKDSGGSIIDTAINGVQKLIANQQLANSLSNIDRSTAETARNTRDYARHALGGGNLGRLGVTALEMREIRRGDRRIVIDVRGGDATIAEMVEQGIRDYEAQRYGS